MHAAGSIGAQWLGVLNTPNNRFHMLTPDLWEHGKTSFWPDPETLSHYDQANLARRILDKTGAETIDLIGDSYGGSTAIQFVLEYPNMVKSLVLIEPMMACFLKETGEKKALK